MSNCPHNLEAALLGRWFPEVPEMSRNLNLELVKKIVAYLVRQLRKYYKPEFSFSAYVKAKKGGSRKRFLKAYNQLLKQAHIGLADVCSFETFVKNERYFEEGKKPRLIMGVDPRYSVLQARFVARMEDAFFQLPQVANKCDYYDCGDKFAKLLGAWMAENDMSSFEGSQREFHAFVEWIIDDMMLEEFEKEDNLLIYAAQCDKRGTAGETLKFVMKWMMGSGLLNTSLGNGKKNYVPTMYFQILNWCPRGADCLFEDCGCLFDKFVLKGDDSYMKIPVGAQITNYYLDWGYKTKMVLRQDPAETEFCSGKFVRLANGDYYYVQKLRKMLESLSVVINSDVVDNGWVAHYYRSLGDMYAQLYRNIPVYEDLAKFLQTASAKLRINVHLVDESFGAHEAYSNFRRNASEVDVNTQTMLDVAHVNDLSLAECEALMQFFRTSAIQLPQHLHRRCNRRNRRVDAVDDIDDEVIYQFDRETLSPWSFSVVQKFRLAADSGEWWPILRDSCPLEF